MAPGKRKSTRAVDIPPTRSAIARHEFSDRHPDHCPAARVPQLRDAVRAAPAGGVVRWGDVLGLPAPSRAECEALDALAVVRAVAAGQAVFAHGQSSRTLVVLLSGDVALGMAMPGGAMRTERLVHGPAWLDASSV